MLEHFVQSCWCQQAHVNIFAYGLSADVIYGPPDFSITLIYNLHLPSCSDSTVWGTKAVFILWFPPIEYVETLYPPADKCDRSLLMTTPATAKVTTVKLVCTESLDKKKKNLDLPESKTAYSLQVKHEAMTSLSK